MGVEVIIRGSAPPSAGPPASKEKREDGKKELHDSPTQGVLIPTHIERSLLLPPTPDYND